MAGKLTIEILSANKVKLNAQYNTLILDGEEEFTVGIKELQEALAPVTSRLDQLDQEIKAAFQKLSETQQQRKIDELSEQAEARKAEGGAWAVMETYEGQMMTHANVSLFENFKQYLRSVKQEISEKQQEVLKLKEQQQAIEANYKDVRWAWHLALKRSNDRGGINEALGRGKTTQTLKMGPHIQGGGFAWLEPFHEAEGATGSTSNGLFIQSSGTQAVTTAEWYAAGQGKPVKIDEAIQPGLKVQLHVYTESMYGHNIQVELKADAKTLPANTYSHQIVTSSDIPGQTIVVTKEDREVVDTENRFFAEVEVYDCSLPNAILPPPGAISGYLLDGGEDDKDGAGKRILNVQKAVLECYIDPAWCADKESIRIIPTVYFGNGETKRLSAAVLEVHNSKPDARLEIPDTGNKPVFVDAVETNFETFHPCRYDQITAIVGEGDPVTIFDSKGTTENADQLVFPVVVGNDSAKKEVQIMVDNAITTECFYIGTEAAHTGKVIDTKSMEARVVTGTETSGSQMRGADVEDHLSGGKKVAKTSKVSNKLKFVNGISSITVQDGFKILEKNSAAEFECTPDKKVKMKLGYDYTFGGTVKPFQGLCETFWPNNIAIAGRYPLTLNTCAYQKQLEVLTYPDSKWTIQLAFNYDRAKFNAVQEQFHQAWNLTGLEAAEEQRRLAGKREGAATNIERYSDQKRRAPQNQKGELQGQIDQQRRKEASYSRRIEEQQQLIDESDKRTSVAGRGAEAWNSAYSADALRQGLVDCELGLIVEFDRPHGKLDLTSGYREIIDFLKKVADIKEKIDAIIDGKDDEARQHAPSESNEKVRRRKAKIEAKAKGKTSKFSFEFIPPSIGLSVGWFAEVPKDIEKPVMGTSIEGVIDFDPLLGFEVEYDLYQLLYRTHPAVAAIAFLLDVLDTVAGDHFDINLKLLVSTKAKGTLKGTVNTAEGSEFLERLMKDDDGTPARISLAVDISIIGEIRVKGKPSALTFFKYTPYADVTASVESGISIDCEVKSNEEMLFVEPAINFEGLVLKYSLDTGIAYDEEEEEDLKGADGIHFNSNGDIVVLDTYTWELSKFRMPIIKYT